MMWRPYLTIVTAILFGTLAVSSVFFVHKRGAESGAARVQAKWDAEVAAMAQAQAEELMKARQREQALEALIARQREEHRREANRIDARFTADIERLRYRPEARAGDGGVPEGAVSGVGCTGLGLSKPDAEFLVRYATSAARQQAALNACIAAYDEVREATHARD